MTKDTNPRLNNENDNEKKFRTMTIILIISVLVIPCFVAPAAIYLFLVQNALSITLFVLAILVFIIGPVTIAIIYYFKRLKISTSQEKSIVVTKSQSRSSRLVDN